MPTNVTPEYKKAEAEYKIAQKLDHETIRKIPRIIKKKKGLLQLNRLFLVMELLEFLGVLAGGLLDEFGRLEVVELDLQGFSHGCFQLPVLMGLLLLLVEYAGDHAPEIAARAVLEHDRVESLGPGARYRDEG